MNIHVIWAQDTNNAIGRNGTLPWHFSEDLKNFKKLTTGHPIIMGRKTWDSLPIKPLPDRRNIVISNSPQSNIESYTSIEGCIESLNNDTKISDVYIIGGMSIYKFFYKHANTLHITFIHKSYPDTDTFFPISLDTIKSDFYLKSKDDVNKDLSFTVWIRK
jgi:dihydrofolate reductase